MSLRHFNNLTAVLRKGRHQGWIPWAVLVVGLGLTGTTATLSKHSLREASEARFEQRSNEIHTALQARLLAFVQSLRDVQAYVGAIGTVTPANWHHMSETLKLAETYPGFEGLIYVRTTNGDQLPALLAVERRRGEKDLSLKPPGQRDFHAVITAIEPHTPNNLQALGYDGWNEPRRRAAMERARDTGTPQITGKIQLHIDRHKSPTPAFLIYQPLYRDGKLPTTVEERRAQLVGFAGNGIRYQDLMRSLLPEGLRDVDIHIYDNPTTEPNAQPDEKDLAYDSLSSFMLPAEPLRRTERLTLGGRPWVLVYQATDRFVSPVEASYPQRLLLVGTLISLLLFALSKTLVHQRLRAEQLASRMTQSLRKSESKLRALVAQAPLGIWVLDRNGVVLECNDKIASYATAPIEKIVGLNMLTEARDKVLGNALQQAVDGTPSSLETTYTSTAGGHMGYYHFHFQPVYVEGELDQIVGFVEDINARKRAEEKLAYLAHHDTLTGLANRTVLKQELHAAIAAAEEKMRAGELSRQVAVLFLDLDRFNTVNDSLGHTIGDALLVKLAHRLVMAAGTNNLLTRIGGDEFVVLLRDIQGPEDCIPVASRLLAAAAQPMAIEDYTLHTTQSIGIACWPSGGHDVESLSRSADMAMYHAKHKGRNNFQFFTHEMRDKAQAILGLESDLHHAIERQEFRLHYQAQMDASTNTIIGAEALIRWYRPGGEIVPPLKFIGFAEDRGLIVSIGEWVIREACRQMRAWADAGYAPIPISVNISAKQFHHTNLLQTVRRALVDYQVPPEWLVLEITESTVMEDPQEAVSLISEFQSLGIRTEIDDFGTGYSSLASLKRFPFHRLKIDKSFIDSVPGDEDDEAIVAAILNIASSLELDVIAEGVETEAQRQYLLLMGCNAMQGFLFARPEPPETLACRLPREPGLFPAAAA